MNIAEIVENTPLHLDEELLAEAIEIKKKDNDLLFDVIDKTLVFKPYTVGEIRIKNLLIRVKPRHDFINLGHIFEMLLFTNMSLDSCKLNTGSFGKEKNYGVKLIYQNYVSILNSLINYGLTTDFKYQIVKSKYINGKLDLKSFNRLLLPYEGLNVTLAENSIDNPGNQIIKMAIRCLLKVCLDQEVESKLYSCLFHFNGVKEISNLSHHLIAKARTAPSSNPNYQTTLEYSLIIISDLKIGYGSGNLDWYAFLTNSNILFEKFVSKILKNGTGYTISKWKNPKDFASLTNRGRNYGTKSFVPDILVDYDSSCESCKAVFDVKNKFINPYANDIMKQISSADIYQILFYCNQLGSKMGGLIYPSDNTSEELKMHVFSRYDLTLFILFVPMNVSLTDKIKSLSEQITNAMEFH